MTAVTRDMLVDPGTIIPVPAGENAVVSFADRLQFDPATAVGERLDRLEQRLHWMETESKFAHACPDLDQEYPDPDHAEAERVCDYTARMWRAATLAALNQGRIESPMTWYLDQLGDA